MKLNKDERTKYNMSNLEKLSKKNKILKNKIRKEYLEFKKDVQSKKDNN